MLNKCDVVSHDEASTAFFLYSYGFGSPFYYSSFGRFLTSGMGCMLRDPTVVLNLDFARSGLPVVVTANQRTGPLGSSAAGDDPHSRGDEAA